MLTSQELTDIASAIADTYNVKVSVSNKTTTLLTNVPAVIMPALATDRYGPSQYEPPKVVDAVMRTAYNTQLRRGLKVTVTSVNGVTATSQDAVTYEILNIDNLFSLDVVYEIKLWRVIL